MSGDDELVAESLRKVYLEAFAAGVRAMREAAAEAVELGSYVWPETAAKAIRSLPDPEPPQ